MPMILIARPAAAIPFPLRFPLNPIKPKMKPSIANGINIIPAIAKPRDAPPNPLLPGRSSPRSGCHCLLESHSRSRSACRFSLCLMSFAIMSLCTWSSAA